MRGASASFAFATGTRISACDRIRHEKPVTGHSNFQNALILLNSLRFCGDIRFSKRDRKVLLELLCLRRVRRRDEDVASQNGIAFQMDPVLFTGLENNEVFSRLAVRSAAGYFTRSVSGLANADLHRGRLRVIVRVDGTRHNDNGMRKRLGRCTDWHNCAPDPEYEEGKGNVSKK